MLVGDRVPDTDRFILFFCSCVQCLQLHFVMKRCGISADEICHRALVRCDRISSCRDGTADHDIVRADLTCLRRGRHTCLVADRIASETDTRGDGLEVRTDLLMDATCLER